MDIISIGEINGRRKKLDFEVLKIDVDLGLPRLRSSIDEIYSRYRPIEKDGYTAYSGLGLQYQNANDPIYDAVEQTSYTDGSGNTIDYRKITPWDFVEKNELGERLSYVFDAFSGVRLFRGRILKASPFHIHSDHVDGQFDCRIHIPVYTNRYCLMFFGDRPYHLPATGGAYLINTSNVHHIVNFSNEDRTHIVFVL